MKNKIEVIQEYCFKNGIYFKALNTPARFYNDKKQTEWSNFFRNDLELPK